MRWMGWLLILILCLGQNGKADDELQKKPPRCNLGHQVQNLWESYDFYGDKKSEFIFERFNSNQPDKKEFYYYTANVPHHYEIKADEKRAHEVKRLVVLRTHEGVYSLRFEQSPRVYRLSFREGAMFCHDGNKIQRYQKVDRRIKPKGPVIFISAGNQWGSSSHRYIFEEVSPAKRRWTFFNGPAAGGQQMTSSCPLSVTSPVPKGTPADVYREVLHSAFKNRTFDLVVEKGLLIIPYMPETFFTAPIGTITPR